MHWVLSFLLLLQNTVGIPADRAFALVSLVHPWPVCVMSGCKFLPSVWQLNPCQARPNLARKATSLIRPVPWPIVLLKVLVLTSYKCQAAGTQVLLGNQYGQAVHFPVSLFFCHQCKGRDKWLVFKAQTESKTNAQNSFVVKKKKRERITEYPVQPCSYILTVLKKNIPPE